MCLMVYLATAREQGTFESAELTVEAVNSELNTVGRLFTLPFVRFVGAHTGCSCGFPSIIAEEPIEYFDGMFNEIEDRAADIESARALLAVVNEHVAQSRIAELYAAWEGDERHEPKGLITLTVAELSAETFFLIERFLYRFVAAPSAS